MAFLGNNCRPDEEREKKNTHTHIYILMSNPFINVPTIINTSCSPLKYLARFVINEIDTSQRVFTIRCSFSDLENGSKVIPNYRRIPFTNLTRSSPKSPKTHFSLSLSFTFTFDGRAVVVRKKEILVKGGIVRILFPRTTTRWRAKSGATER